MEWIKKEDWIPKDEFQLEKEAMETVRSEKNTLVVAGPGAGKTELLAQRACYLLETNTARHPKKILALSFKRDAASNLKERVELRCGKDLSLRFESKTYDAFAKEILDRFKNSIDERYKPSESYKIGGDEDVKNAFITSGVKSNLNNNVFREKYIKQISNKRLPLIANSENQKIITAIDLLIKGDVENNFNSTLTFGMISRLSEYLIRLNVYIKRAIEMTYSHVFLDEFQDTTANQYELLKTCFYRTDVIVTAVGDDKQRIMVWAGAKKTIFQDFINEFDSLSQTLIMNHRSAPRLIEIQKAMYKILNKEEIDIETNAKWSQDDGEAYLRIFGDYKIEARVIRDEVVKLIDNGIKINEICILVKQQVGIYCAEIISVLSEQGIQARDEGIYQDLLKEPIIKVLVSFFRLAIGDGGPDDWEFLYSVLSDLEGIYENTNTEELDGFINNLDIAISDIRFKITVVADENQFSESVDSVVDNYPYERFASRYQQYGSKEYFDKLVEDFKKLIWEEFNKTRDWIKAIDNFEGKNSIPIMTIHKSKGLEFDTIFFVGLEDAAFWNFKNQPDEDRRAFFVALSRAKRRIDFTFSESRPTNYHTEQKHVKINEFYEILENSNVIQRVDYRPNTNK